MITFDEAPVAIENQVDLDSTIPTPDTAADNHPSEIVVEDLRALFVESSDVVSPMKAFYKAAHGADPDEMTLAHLKQRIIDGETLDSVLYDLDTQIKHYVNESFQHILAKPADDGSLLYWSDKLRTGTSHTEFRTALVSDTSVVATLVKAYTAAYGAAPDEVTLHSLQDTMIDGATRADVTIVLIAKLQNFVVDTFNDIVGSIPNMVVRVHWMSSLLNGVSHEEFRATLVASQSVVDDLSTAYQSAHGIMPDHTYILDVQRQIIEGSSLAEVKSAILSYSAENYISDLFHDVLSKNVDSASLSYWSAQLKAGLDRAEMRTIFATSSEVEVIIKNSYAAAFGSAPDASTVLQFQSRIIGGETLNEVREPLLSEAKDFIIRSFQDVLGKQIDAKSTTYWTNQLVAGRSQREVLTLFANAPEAISFINKFYSQVYGYSPDASALQELQQYFIDGNSRAEIKAQLLLQSMGVIKALFQATLERDPTDADVSHVRSQAWQGATESEIRRALAFSDEAAHKITADYVNKYGSTPSGSDVLRIQDWINSGFTVDQALQMPGQAPAYKSLSETIGISDVQPAYKFTADAGFLEVAKGIRELGSETIKINLIGQGYENTLTKSAMEAQTRVVLDMDFKNYFIWTDPRPTVYQNWYAPQNLELEYRQMYDLTKYLLNTYSDSGKTFYLGNWEGDWVFKKVDIRSTNWTGSEPSDQDIQNAINWANIRQKAVDDAERDTPHSGVRIFNYLEANLVVDAMLGDNRIANSVIPHVNVDYISYSAYDSLGYGSSTLLNLSLDYLQSLIVPKSEIIGKRVIIGEFGYAEPFYGEEDHDRLSLEVVNTALDWGTPFVLQWGFYANPDPSGKTNGYWLVDDQNVKQKLYYSYKSMFADA